MPNNKKTRLILIIAFGALLIVAVYFILKTYSLSKALSIAKTDIASVQKNDKVIDFTRVFIEKVLNADREVDFNTRLQLENDVRNLKDDEILAGWQKFTESKTNTEAADNVKELLKILIMKAS
ncbi:MAG: hypothetical protein A2664_02175 [Candidatus Taylorbacteria bacterium RIFCSPHIGHO2_01_FULL_46_22b]|uniref:Uncharacterized protein n=1 Tax=Candidatus Taylorbacteria bacterium RIFCSPHIGHO2_01_FULL_46_22b TaxID=1802301 RepID=A0A1G2M2Y0_9BACT|nr:MAG: hypothetical protein A2664_02175 [Candidatus Taylorbacteria bacterium RIFCSPHIGHO2_01_FULL_46_22b]